MCYIIDWSPIVAGIGVLVSGFLAYKSWKSSQKSADSAAEARRSERLQEQMFTYRTMRKFFLLSGGNQGNELNLFESLPAGISYSSGSPMPPEEIARILTMKTPVHGAALTVELYSDVLSCLRTYDSLFTPIRTNNEKKTEAEKLYSLLTQTCKPIVFPINGLVIYEQKTKDLYTVPLSNFMGNMMDCLTEEFKDKAVSSA